MPAGFAVLMGQWKQASAAADAAEAELLSAFERYSQGLGDPPTEEQAMHAARLREAEQQALKTALAYMETCARSLIRR
jgi:hypothetical protein